MNKESFIFKFERWIFLYVLAQPASRFFTLSYFISLVWVSGKFRPCKKVFSSLVAGVYFSKTFCVQKWISFYHYVKVVICSFVFQGIFLGYGDWKRLRMVRSCYAECLYLLFVVNHVCSNILLFLCCRQLGLVDIFVSKWDFNSSSLTSKVFSCDIIIFSLRAKLYGLLFLVCFGWHDV